MSAANPEQLYCCHTPRFNNFKNWSSHRYTSCQHPSRHCTETQTTRAAAVQGQLAAKGRAKCKSEESAWGSGLGGRWVSVSSCCCDKYLNKSHRGRKGLFWSQIQVTVYHCGEVRQQGHEAAEHIHSREPAENHACTLPVHSSLSPLMDSSDLLPPTQNNLQYFRDLKHFLIYQKYIKEYDIVTES